MLGTPFLTCGYAYGIERKWLRTKHHQLNPDGVRIAHFSDLHYKGDKSLFEGVIERIHRSDCEFAVFTGDLIDGHDETYLDEALEAIASIEIPVFGVPGNHDRVDAISTERYRQAFRQTGGDWLFNETASMGGFDVYGTVTQQVPVRNGSGKKALLLAHYPATCDRKSNSKFDLVLSGHSHGGQIRLPFFGPMILPSGVGAYDRGLFETNIGPLHVSQGVGWFKIPARFLCPPEVSILTV